ncbi:MAG: FtsX-like permease family protein [SAR202 cluster bacterium]|nr:FtsX-like permease family protein [SAR202 cluster bacterium]
MRKIDRMLLRGLWAAKLQYGALVLLLTLGIAIFGGSYAGYLNLGESEERTYDELLLADAFFRVAQSPATVVQEVADTAGVEAVEGRIVHDVGLADPKNPGELLSARMISTPDDGRPMVNDVWLEEGAYLPSDASDSVLIDDAFAAKNDLFSGDEIELALADGRAKMTIAGRIVSPEYIFKAKSLQEPFVAPGAFAVVFARQAVAERLFDEVGTINEVVVRFAEGADHEATTVRIQQVLAPYNLLESTPRERQPSYMFLKLDLEGFGEIAAVVPAMFLIITALAILVLMTRTVSSQRGQIGLLSAVGYGRGQVVRHYLGYALAVGVAGCVLGTVVAYGLAALITSAYADVVNIPVVVIDAHWPVFGIGIGLGIGTCVVAGLLPAWGGASLEPAAAMRPPVPTGGRLTVLDRLLPTRRVPFVWRLALRSLFRQPRRSLVNAAGVAVSVSLIVASLGMLDTIDNTMDLQFGQIEAYDVKATMAGPVPAEAVDEFAGLAGVRRVEPLVESPVRLATVGRSYSTLLVGLSPQGELYRPLEKEGGRPLAISGLYLSTGISNELGAGIGDVLDVQTPFGVQEMAIAGTVRSPLSTVAYVALDDAWQLLGTPDVITGALLAVDPERISAVKESVSAMPGVINVEALSEKRDAIADFMALFYQFVAVFVLFGVALAFLVVFNTVSMNVMERARELATMRTLGFGSRSITALITLENAIGAIVGIGAGIGLGYLMAVELMRAFESDSFSFNVALYTRTYVAVAVGMGSVVLLSQAPGVRHVNRMDLARVTKEQSG